MSDPSDRDRVTAILTPEVVEIARRCRCCGSPSMCGACCMDDEQSHDAARLAAEIDRLARRLLEALDTIDRLEGENELLVQVASEACDGVPGALDHLGDLLARLNRGNE